MPGDKRKINCWIPASLYDKIGSAGYENTTQTILTALQRLRESSRGYRRIQAGAGEISAGVLELSHL